jgi:hypothetical protein
MKTSGLFVVCLAVAAMAADPPLTREALEKGFFQSVGAKPTDPPQLLLRFKDTGTRFLCLRNNQEEKVNDYGETMALNLGDTFSVTEHHAGLEFRPLPQPLDKNGWLIESEFDARSFGGNISTRYGIVLILKNSEGAELRFVEPASGFNPELPATDPTYQTILQIVSEAEPLGQHELVGDAPSGEVKPPFSHTIAALHFRWNLRPGAGDEPVEIRWIAVAVSGVEKNHLIATSKSGTDKREGEFNLKKPATGFPAGQYRVEIWQAGKMIYSEKFAIKPD